MTIRKILPYLLTGLLLVLTIGFLLFPTETGLASADKTAGSYERERPNYDALAAVPRLSTEAQALNVNKFENGRMVQTEPRFDVPTFLWAANEGKARTLSSDAVQRSADIEAIARGHLSGYASRYRLVKSDVAEATLAAIHDTGSGAIIVKFKQTFGGVEVFRDEINVIMNRDLKLVALSGYLTGDHTKDLPQDFVLQPVDALAGAVSDLTGSRVDPSKLKTITVEKTKLGDPYQRFTADKGSVNGIEFSDEPSRVKEVMFHLPDGYVPAYYVETSFLAPADSDNLLSADGTLPLQELGYSYVISAIDGQILFRKNLVNDQKRSRAVRGQVTQSATIPSDTFTYRVWADTTTLLPFDSPAGNSVHPKDNATPDGGQFPFVAQQDVTLQNFPFSMNDPWLPAGATETNGNNVDAFLNLFTPDGFGTATTTTPTDFPTGDYRAQATGVGQFLHTNVAGTDHSTAAARQASISQLFYQVNFLHDWFYDSGFNEASGNAQTNNFGRGGFGNDSIKAQVDDFAGFSNANMLTPADGGRPRMRMYVFPNPANVIDIQAPAAIATKTNIGISMTGTQAFDVTADIIQATFTAGPTTCTITNDAALVGKIALFDFDNTDGTGCSFSTRITRIAATGAVGMVMVYTSANAGAVANITGFNAGHTKPITTISWNAGAPIKTQLAIPAIVTARLNRVPDRDGSLDNQIVSHEWGHYLSNRLIGNSWGINNNQAGGMGEGWGDFTAMLLTVRPDDTTNPTNATYNGTYGLATYATSGTNFNGVGNHGYYFGIRRLPYSTDMTKNGLTLKHIANGNALPVGPPTAFGADGASNSEVHNTGEVWTTMLWECYAALLRDTQGAAPRLTFQQAQTRMRNYLVASLKMTPLAPTFLEARDAVLAAAFANDPADGQLFAAAFAKRGAGMNAVAPDRYSTSHAGVVESFTNTGKLTFVGATVDDSIQTYDSDGYLDQKERGRLNITVKNTGLVALTGTTANVSSTDPRISFPAGNSINIPTLQPQVPVTVSIDVDAGYMGTALRTSTFNITLEEAGNTLEAAAVPIAFTAYTNADELAATSATDSVEAKPNLWTIASNPGLVTDTSAKWQRLAVGSLNHVWFAPDVNGPSDQILTSPVMTVDGSGSFNLQFDHSYGVEFDGGGNYDGGVVEVSVNGGAFTDIDSSAYNGTIIAYSGNANPLAGRSGFVRNSSGTIHSSLTRAIAAGSTVQFRFRAGSDNSFGGAGWQIDAISASGVVETPFTTLVGELSPFAVTVTVSGRVVARGRGASGEIVSTTDPTGVTHRAVTNTLGYYKFTGLPIDAMYTFQIASRRYTYTPQVLSVNNAIADLNFEAQQ